MTWETNHSVCYTSHLGQRIETSFKVVFVYAMFTSKITVILVLVI